MAFPTSGRTSVGLRDYSKKSRNATNVTKMTSSCQRQCSQNHRPCDIHGGQIVLAKERNIHFFFQKVVPSEPSLHDVTFLSLLRTLLSNHRASFCCRFCSLTNTPPALPQYCPITAAEVEGHVSGKRHPFTGY